MAIPVAKIKSLCTPSEIAILQASRQPELEKLSPAAIKRLAVQARGLLKKWEGLGRDQSRALGRKTGASGVPKNTELKSQAFREALEVFETKLTKSAAAVKSGAKPAAAPVKTKSKKDRSAEHRATRAAVRKGMVAVEDLLNTRVKKKPAKKSTKK